MLRTTRSCNIIQSYKNEILCTPKARGSGGMVKSGLTKGTVHLHPTVEEINKFRSYNENMLSKVKV